MKGFSMFRMALEWVSGNFITWPKVITLIT
jgi:hypothetical protein